MEKAKKHRPQPVRTWESFASPGQRRAVDSVRLLIMLLPIVRPNQPQLRNISGSLLHVHFLRFSEALPGLDNLFYKKNSRGMVEAVALYGHSLSYPHPPLTVWKAEVVPSMDRRERMNECLALARKIGLDVQEKDLVNAAERFWSSAF